MEVCRLAPCGYILRVSKVEGGGAGDGFIRSALRKTCYFFAVGGFLELRVVSFEEVAVFLHFAGVGAEDGVDGINDFVDTVIVKVLGVCL